MPLSKRVHVREYTVRAHERVIYERTYIFVCKGCDESAERVAFGGRPEYCINCRPPKPVKTETKPVKKLPRPVVVRQDSQAS